MSRPLRRDLQPAFVKQINLQSPRSSDGEKEGGEREREICGVGFSRGRRSTKRERSVPSQLRARLLIQVDTSGVLNYDCCVGLLILPRGHQFLRVGKFGEAARDITDRRPTSSRRLFAIHPRDNARNFPRGSSN